MGEYNPLERDYIYQLNKDLDIDKMKEAIKYFEGTHDFKSFTKNNDEKDDFIRTITKAEISKEDNIIIISFLGTGFLRYMVRNMVGCLIEVGELKRESVDVKHILEAKDRTKAGITAHPEGLYLKEVYYK